MLIQVGEHTLLTGIDCRAAMDQLPAASVAAVATDEPYGTASASKVQTRSGKAGAFDEPWDRLRAEGWLEAAARVLVPGGTLIAFGDNKAPLWAACEAAGLRPVDLIAWTKPNPPPNPRRKPASAFEVAVIARKPGGRATWNAGGVWLNWRAMPAPGAGERHFGARNKHRTVKPVELFRWLLQAVTQPGDVVLDPFLGSGTTAIACELEGRICVGFELNPEAGTIQGRLQAFHTAAGLWRLHTAEALPTAQELVRWYKRVS